MAEWAKQPAVTLVKAIQEKKISASELLEYFIERFERLNPKINAIVATNFDQARKQAANADKAQARGEILGPLHGLPVSIKDNIEVIGMPTTFGSVDTKDYKPVRNASVVQSLVDAGAIIFGKTNLPTLGSDWQSFNDLHGQTSNPWKLSRTPGGSSGGSAAALAGGLTGLEIGNDLGGSIRVPAHFSGVYGHKSSFDIIPTDGCTMPRHEPNLDFTVSQDMGVNGPLARSAEDLKLAMDVIVRPPSFQRKAVNIVLPPPRKTKLNEFKVGLWMEDPQFSPDTFVGNCLQNLIDQLARVGVNVKEKKQKVDLIHSTHLQVDLVNAAVSPFQPDEFFKWAQNALKTLKADDESSTARFIRGITLSHRDWHKLNQERIVMRQKWADIFQEIDVLLCPVMCIAAHPHDHTELGKRIIRCNGQDHDYRFAAVAWNSFCSLAYLPATVAPIGFTPDNLPVGVQIVGPYLEDLTPIQFAISLEKEIIGPYQLPREFKQ